MTVADVAVEDPVSPRDHGTMRGGRGEKMGWKRGKRGRRRERGRRVFQREGARDERMNE